MTGDTLFLGTKRNDLEATTLVGDGPVTLELYGNGVSHVHLNRPATANCLDLEMLRGLNEVLMRVHGDSRVRAVLLSGGGKNFCAGGDVRAFLAQGERLPEYVRQATILLQHAVSLLMRINPPVVTAVQGFAAGGGGLGLVCSSDVVLAGESTKFLAGATRVGMVPDAGVSVTLTQLVGLRKAMEILFFNPVIAASEALTMGLVTRVVSDAALLDEAWAMCCQLAAGAPAALAATKRLLWSGLGQGVDAAMPEENNTQMLLSAMQDAREGLVAVAEKRAPKFTGR
jgi:2-(1,2-epoxy-1,2-dihydrophenyl)acetyl-CoA isomerase